MGRTIGSLLRNNKYFFTLNVFRDLLKLYQPPRVFGVLTLHVTCMQRLFSLCVGPLLCSWIHQRRHAVTVCPASRLMACVVWLSAHNAVARAVDARPGGPALFRVTAALEPLHPQVYPAMTPGWHPASSTVVGVLCIVLSIRKNSIPDSWG